MNRSVVVVSICGLCTFAGAASAQYTFGGAAGGAGWTWDGAGMGAYRNAISNPANFGAGGVVSSPVATTTLGSVTAASLAGVNCFVSPAMADGQFSGASLDAIKTFFLGGGDLLLLNDSNSYDPIGELLGLPTSGNIGSTSASGSGAPLMSGPFGSVTSVNQWYLVGALDPAAVAAKNGHVAATNFGGAAIAYWNAGEYAPGAGKLVIITDVDTLAGTELGYGGGATYATLNDNGRLGLNVANFFVVPTPGAGAMMLAAGLVTGRRRRG